MKRGGDGYIRIYRSFFDRGDFLAPSWKYPACNGYAFAYLIAMAQWRTRKHGGRTLHRGELFVSVRTLAGHLKWSKSRVSRWIRRCVERDMLRVVERDTAGTVYCVVRYDDYNPPGLVSGTASGTPSETPAGHERDKNKEGRQEGLTSFSLAHADERGPFDA